MTKKLLGAEHPATINSMKNLACTYRDQGRISESEKLEHQVMNIVLYRNQKRQKLSLIVIYFEYK